MNFVASIKQRFPNAFYKSKVLEIGSYNVNGSIRLLFDYPELYIGLDLAPGKDVDVVCRGHEYDTTLRFDTVISTECFEHDPHWYYTFLNMHRLARRNACVIFTCAANNRHEHGTPRTTPSDSALASDYYKNLNVLDFETSYNLREMFSDYSFQARDNDLYFFGVKR